MGERGNGSRRKQRQLQEAQTTDRIKQILILTSLIFLVFFGSIEQCLLKQQSSEQQFVVSKFNNYGK